MGVDGRGKEPKRTTNNVTYKNDKDYIKKQINALVKLTNKKGVSGAKEKAIWSQIDNLRSSLGTLNNAKRRSQVRANGTMTLPGGRSITTVKGVMMNNNEARAALSSGAGRPKANTGTRRGGK